MKALQSHALFVYFGHGSGEQYLPLAAMRSMRCCAANLLMGCSSGRLRPHGEYEPAGAVLSYIAAGCPAVVANLWDVTDRDIDRFSQTLLRQWLGPRAPPPATSVNSGQAGGLASVGAQVSAACASTRTAGKARPKAGKARAVEDEADDFAGLEGVGAQSQDICIAVNASRGACKLRHLIGSAPVCYGLPTSVVWEPGNTLDLN
ncbi:peptidase family C50-domain-containing protein [Haematococcus lacustris]